MTGSLAVPAAQDELLVALRERKGLLDAVWISSFVVASMAVAIPWFVHVSDLHLAPAAWLAFGYALAHVAAAAAADRLRSARWLLGALQAHQAAGMLCLALLWHLSGGLENPTLLLVFSLPVAASGALLVRWQPYVTALLSVLAVSVVALVESPELRWYALQVGLPVGPLLRVLPTRLPWTAGWSGGLLSSPAYLFGLLTVFAALQVGSAILSGWLARQLERVHSKRATVEAAAARIGGLFQALFDAAPAPAVLVHADDGRIVQASEAFVKRMLLHGEDLAGRDLFEVLSFSEPGRIRGLLASAGGAARLCAYRVCEEPRLASVNARAVSHGGARYSLVTIQDLTELYYLEGALDGVEDALLILGSDDRLRYASPGAQALFGEIYFGMEASQALAAPGLPQSWWRAEAATSEEGELRIGGDSYRVERATTRVPVEAEPLALLKLRRPPHDPAGVRE